MMTENKFGSDFSNLILRSSYICSCGFVCGRRTCMFELGADAHHFDLWNFAHEVPTETTTLKESNASVHHLGDLRGILSLQENLQSVRYNDMFPLWEGIIHIFSLDIGIWEMVRFAMVWSVSLEPCLEQWCGLYLRDSSIKIVMLPLLLGTEIFMIYIFPFSLMSVTKSTTLKS